MKRKTLTLLLILLLILPTYGAFASSNLSNIGTHAGTGIIGYNDGARQAAQFRFPSYATMDASGNIYVSDSMNHRIRKIASNGTVTTVAGTATQRDEYGQYVGGNVDGPAASAMFNEPKGIAVTASGVIYVADSKNGSIRKIEGNTVSTIAKDLKLPTGLVLGNNGELYVSETLNHRILKVSADGTSTVLAGGGYTEANGYLRGGLKNGTGLEAQFNEPTGLAISANGTLYVADTANQRIRTISPNGEVKTIAGSGNDVVPNTTYLTGGYANGQAMNARFNFPHGVSVTNEGTVYVADTLNHKIRKISTNGQVTTVAGRNGHGYVNHAESSAAFDRPHDVLVLQDGSLAVVDYWNHALRNIEWYYLPNEVKNRKDLHVVWQNKIVNFDVKPEVKAGRTMLPIRQLAQGFGYEVDWKQDTQTITFTSGSKKIQMKVGSKAITGDVNLTMDIEPYVQNGRTLVPVRFVSEAFDKDVRYFSDTKTVLIR